MTPVRLKHLSNLPNPQETKLFALFGNPVAHSLSPLIYNALFKQFGFNHIYLPFQIEKDQLKSAIQALRILGCPGGNVTIPFKEAAYLLMPHATLDAKIIGAINTIDNKGGFLFGHNTDWQGFLTSLTTETSFQPKDKSAILLGAGGVSKAIAYGLCKSGCRRITLLNRSVNRALKLIESLRPIFPAVLFCCPALASITPAEMSSDFESCDLIVNCTPIGLSGYPADLAFFQQFPFKRLPKNCIMSDLIYNPLLTPFLKTAEFLGLKTHSGLGMLIHQAALNFEIWTGQKAPVSMIQETLRPVINLEEAGHEKTG